MALRIITTPSTTPYPSMAESGNTPPPHPPPQPEDPCKSSETLFKLSPKFLILTNSSVYGRQNWHYSHLSMPSRLPHECFSRTLIMVMSRNINRLIGKESIVRTLSPVRPDGLLPWLLPGSMQYSWYDECARLRRQIEGYMMVFHVGNLSFQKWRWRFCTCMCTIISWTWKKVAHSFSGSFYWVANQSQDVSALHSFLGVFL